MADWRRELVDNVKQINNRLKQNGMTLSEEKEVEELREPATKVYKCDHCDFQTTNRHKFAAHARKHKDEKKEDD